MCTPFPRRQWMVLHFFPRPSANSISIIHRSYARKGKHDNMCLILTVHPVWWMKSVEFKNVVGGGNICLCLCLLQVRTAVSPPHQTVPADIHSPPPSPPASHTHCGCAAARLGPTGPHTTRETKLRVTRSVRVTGAHYIYIYILHFRRNVSVEVSKWLAILYHTPFC